MAVAIDEVQVSTQEPPPAAPSGAAPAGPQRIDPEQLRMIIRREEDRRARLWVD